MKLLLAEDDRIVRITVRDALLDDGYSVTECPDGTGALRALQAEAFDIVLTDVRLPGLDGIALFRAARRANPRGAVVLMTAFADSDDAVAVMRAGARGAAPGLDSRHGTAARARSVPRVAVGYSTP